MLPACFGGWQIYTSIMIEGLDCPKTSDGLASSCLPDENLQRPARTQQNPNPNQPSSCFRRPSTPESRLWRRFKGDVPMFAMVGP